MDNHVRIEQLVVDTFHAYVVRPVDTRLESARANTQFLKVFIVSLIFPFYVLILLFCLIVGSFRLALANADRVIFVFASAILSFYQVPRKVFYIYITVLSVTGFLQFLRADSVFRMFLLYTVDLITIGKANLFLRKFTNLHFSNPYTRTRTSTQVVFFPVGQKLPFYDSMKVFKFPVSPDLNLFKEGKIVGNCTITIKTVQGSSALEESSTVRSLRVKAPWGFSRVTLSMEDENLGRFINYLEYVAANECEQVLCTKTHYHEFMCRALTIAETIEYFNSGLSLVKLDILGDDDNYDVY